jgi:phosphate transport system substrate-binding protein
MKKQTINKKIRGVGFWGVLMGTLFFVSGSEAQAETPLKGTIKIDGSSTVFPISEGMAEEFQGIQPKTRVTVGLSGTGGGFKKFCAGETDISDASRPIKQKEIDACRDKGIQYIELPVAFDGLSVMVNPKNDFVNSLTVAELKKIWEPGSTVKKWSDVRPEWPDRAIHLYGPGTDSGTFDYFTEVINGKSQASRPDYTASEDDNVLVTGIAGDIDALGYFGYAYYVENKDRLKVVAIDGGKGPIQPTEETIMDGSYAPLSRPIFIYVRLSSAGKAEVEAFVRFYLQKAPEIVPQVGYVAFKKNVYQAALDRFEQRKLGSVFASAKPGSRVEDLVKQ